MRSEEASMSWAKKHAKNRVYFTALDFYNVENVIIPSFRSVVVSSLSLFHAQLEHTIATVGCAVQLCSMSICESLDLGQGVRM